MTIGPFVRRGISTVEHLLLNPNERRLAEAAREGRGALTHQASRGHPRRSIVDSIGPRLRGSNRLHRLVACVSPQSRVGSDLIERCRGQSLPGMTIARAAGAVRPPILVKGQRASHLVRIFPMIGSPADKVNQGTLVCVPRIRRIGQRRPSLPAPTNAAHGLRRSTVQRLPQARESTARAVGSRSGRDYDRLPSRTPCSRSATRYFRSSPSTSRT